jgi:2-polyprenyl-3-methyl-5-hydroxy-6-metoxy-1,4-benzoquinol methylase
MDWTELRTDPNNSDAMQAVHDHLLSIRAVRENSYLEWLVERVKGKTCLDVGAIEHDMSYVDKDTWKHKKLVNSATRVVGIDIIESYVQQLNERGYDIRLCDATSEEYLGEKFDIVVVGDVLEHVINPGDLLRFALRHLNVGGEVIVKTPNPYYKWCIKSFIKKKIYINLEHVAWYSPSQILEMTRRTGCVLKSYIIEFSDKKPWYWKFVNPELFSRDYVYIFTHK